MRLAGLSMQIWSHQATPLLSCVIWPGPVDASVKAITVESIVLSFNMVIRGRPERGWGWPGIPDVSHWEKEFIRKEMGTSSRY